VTEPKPSADDLPRAALPKRPPAPDAALLDRAHKTVDRLFGQLDWKVLGDVYCEEGGDAFWAVHRGPARRAGIAWGRAATERLTPGGRSLWIGAGVAELAALVFEVVVRDRTVVASNLRAAECEVLDAALAAVGLGDRLRVRPVAGGRDVLTEAGIEAVDHLGMVSVLTDPERFPQLAGVTYGRIAPVLLDLERFADERELARREVAEWLGCLTVPGIVTTSVEEVSWILDAARERWRVDADEEVFESEVVGDPVGFLYLQSAVAGDPS
jgi:hypothetical protein